METMDKLIRGRRVLIVGHADGDGYLAAEQSRRNADNAGAKSCELLVDPAITPGYRFWERYLHDLDVTESETVVFVDLMLNYKDPLDSFEKIRRKAVDNPTCQFVIIDHHPVAALPDAPDNVRFLFTDKVYDCCLGEPSDLMVVASICDRDEKPVHDRITDVHRRRAIGVTRAAADRQGLAGRTLLSLLKEDRWDVLEALGQEDRQFHRTVRGVRISANPSTPALQVARAVAR